MGHTRTKASVFVVLFLRQQPLTLLFTMDTFSQTNLSSDLLRTCEEQVVSSPLHRTLRYTKDVVSAAARLGQSFVAALGAHVVRYDVVRGLGPSPAKASG